jgi:hypothetical protein
MNAATFAISSSVMSRRGWVLLASDSFATPPTSFDLVPTRANGQPAFGAYRRASSGVRHGTGLLVLTLAGDRISSVTRFDTSVLPWFGLPRSLASR